MLVLKLLDQGGSGPVGPIAVACVAAFGGNKQQQKMTRIVTTSTCRCHSKVKGNDQTHHHCTMVELKLALKQYSSQKEFLQLCLPVIRPNTHQGVPRAWACEPRAQQGTTQPVLLTRFPSAPHVHSAGRAGCNCPTHLRCRPWPSCGTWMLQLRGKAQYRAGCLPPVLVNKDGAERVVPVDCRHERCAEGADGVPQVLVHRPVAQLPERWEGGHVGVG